MRRALPDSLGLKSAIRCVSRPILNLPPSRAHVVAHPNRCPISEMHRAGIDASADSRLDMQRADLPSWQHRRRHLPILPRFIGVKKKRTLDRANANDDLGHGLPPECWCYFTTVSTGSPLSSAGRTDR